MELPPIWQRIPHHAGIFDADRSYCEYNRHFTNIFEGAKGKTIVVFGAGMLFEDYFEKHGKEYKPEFLADNDKSKWGIKRHGISIKSPDELLNIPKEKLHLIICNIYYRQIEKQLKEMGICDYKIYAKEKQFIAAEEEKGR
ncbi:MAG TPA: hypothetical protein DCP97_03970 [Ruminococcaceae bacterium]|nr:hypothetical protein [Oscillospiraceae bacterium]